MFARSEFHSTNNGLKPLFAHEAPEPVSISVETRRDVKQYELVLVRENTSGNKGMVVADETIILSSAGTHKHRLAVTAYDAKAGQTVQVYMQGSFNIDALYLNNVQVQLSSSSGKPFHELTNDQKIYWLNRAMNENVSIFFYELPTDKIQSK